MLRLATLLIIMGYVVTDFTAEAASRRVRQQHVDYQRIAQPDPESSENLDLASSLEGFEADEPLDMPEPSQRYSERKDRLPNFGFPEKRLATGKRTFIFARKLHAWGAYNEAGQLLKVGYASGGKGWCPDIGGVCQTPVGDYSVYRKHDAYYRSKSFPRRASGIHGGAPMPYAMFFHGGYAVHASHHVPDYHASHGCVRVMKHEAQWLSENFIQKGTLVKVMEHPHDDMQPAEIAENKSRAAVYAF